MKGIGKNALIDGICKLFGDYSGKLTNIEDITKKFNAHLTRKFLFMVMKFVQKQKH